MQMFRKVPMSVVLKPVVLALLAAGVARAQKTPDVVVFTNGEQLTGELEKANADGITFKSGMAGQVTVPWANIKTLTSAKSFAILTAKQKLTRKDAGALVPQGKIAEADKQITVTGAAGVKTIPIADARLLVDSGDFDKAVNHPPNLLEGWGGSATAGATLVRATQTSTTFNGAINLVRATPMVDWLPARNRSILGYSQAYGTTSQVGTPTVKTNIFHANAERDEYVSARLFGFGSATFDHNFSQSLQLQQAYGGGLGVTIFKGNRRQLDAKADVHYQKESFFDPTQNQNLLGSTFSETYLERISKRGLVFTESGSISPAWNVPNAYSAHVQGNLVFPVYKGFAFNVGAVDDYLNNAPMGSNKNSSQFTTGITYVIRPR
jgi:hypothetical protein